MTTHIFPSKDRLCVNFPTLVPEVPQNKIRDCLESRGFIFAKVDIVALAYEQLGKAYKRGSHPDSGLSFDCSSLTQWLYSKLGVYIPRISIDQRGYGRQVSHSSIKKGDLVFTTGAIDYYWQGKENEGVGHVGIFTGKSVIHAANKIRGVVEDSLEDFVKDNFRGATRILPFPIVEADTLIMPEREKVEYDAHLRWRILGWLR